MLVGCGWWSQCVDSTDASKRVVALSSTLDRSISVEEGTRTPFGPSRPISTRPRFRFGREGANEEESPEFGSTASRAKVVVPPPPSPTTAGSRLCPPRPTAPFGHLSPSIHGLVNTGNSCRGSLHTIDRNEQPTAPPLPSSIIIIPFNQDRGATLRLYRHFPPFPFAAVARFVPPRLKLSAHRPVKRSGHLTPWPPFSAYGSAAPAPAAARLVVPTPPLTPLSPLLSPLAHAQAPCCCWVVVTVVCVFQCVLSVRATKGRPKAAR